MSDADLADGGQPTVVVEPRGRPRSRAERWCRTTRRDESGLAVLDVLVGMALFGLLALIALQSVSQYRGKVYMTGALSDLTDVREALEVERVARGYPEFVRTSGGWHQGCWGGTFEVPTDCVNLSKATKGNEVDLYAYYDRSVMEYFGFPGQESYYLCLSHYSNGGGASGSNFNDTGDAAVSYAGHLNASFKGDKLGCFGGGAAS